MVTVVSSRGSAVRFNLEHVSQTVSDHPLCELDTREQSALFNALDRFNGATPTGCQSLPVNETGS